LAIETAALEAIITTLAENARQAGANQFAIGATVTGGEVRIALADNGLGIPEADRERVFDPFFTSKRSDGGSGLGLPIARALAENSFGRLELAPSEVGTTLVLTLPLART
jgi:signal transduction histidine kinase